MLKYSEKLSKCWSCIWIIRPTIMHNSKNIIIS
ncbi:unnamed protein product [Schistosoma curassoni]|uniref:Uncharacterized protein n=1 Tax=Schistosoma curassoni TaxID=6186 RepID=A0A183KHX0_9TREM|nr:unnamed protein product [Schistosoma curassoni]